MNSLLGWEINGKEIILPLGISFITFQQIAFLIDTFRGEIKECSVNDYLLFITYFPHVSSGPIILYKEFATNLVNTYRKVDWNKIAIGLYMFAMGLGKKVIIADTFSKAVNWGYSHIHELNSTSALFITIAYSLQIYFDFSGYSDMAIGISRMLQFDLPANFNSPYKAKNILEFWDRWHMTLTRFFSKYLYIPLGGNRKGTGQMYINTMIVFLCSGLWHGANWTFVLWGFLHGCCMVLTKKFGKVLSRLPGFVGQLATFSFISFTWILFRAESFGDFKDIVYIIVQNKWGRLNDEICSFFNLFNRGLFIHSNVPEYLGASAMMLIALWMVFGCRNVQEKAASLKYKASTGIFVAFVLIISIMSFSEVNTFVYAMF